MAGGRLFPVALAPDPEGVSPSLSHAYILPSFDYCDVVWSGCTKGEALPLEILLNFACRTVLSRRRDYFASAARSDHGLSTLSARRKLHLAQTMFKCLSSQSLPYLSQLSSSQPLTITLVPLLLVNLICRLQELASGKRLSVLLVLPCASNEHQKLYRLRSLLKTLICETFLF